MLLKNSVESIADNLLNTHKHYMHLWSEPDSDKEKLKKIIKSRTKASYDVFNNYITLYPGLEILGQLKLKADDMSALIGGLDE